MDTDYYAVLGVDRAEDLHAIQAAYRKLAMQCHPDRAGTQGKERFQAIQEAYEVLSDAGRRKAYDARVDRRTRRQAASHIAPEPLVPSHHPFSRPEPLVRPFPPADDICAPPSSHGIFCHDFTNELQAPCPFCQGFDPRERDMTEFLVRVLRAFRGERF